MQALKALVIIMGILIVAGFAVVIVTIVNRLSQTAEEGSAPPGFGEAALPVPVGCRVTAMLPAEERLVLQLGGGGACGQIVILDMESGAVLGRFVLTPEADAAP